MFNLIECCYYYYYYCHFYEHKYNDTSVLYKYWFLIELISRILYSGTSPLGHLCPFRGHKIWQRTNIHIIFLSITSVEGTPLLGGKGHFFWVQVTGLTFIQWTPWYSEHD